MESRTAPPKMVRTVKTIPTSQNEVKNKDNAARSEQGSNKSSKTLKMVIKVGYL